MMPVQTNMLEPLGQRLDEFTPAERKIAEFVLADPESVVRTPITEFAALCGTSSASVVRFVKMLGFAGYKEFRLALAGDLQRRETARERFAISDGEIDDGDDARMTVLKVAYTQAATLERTARGIDIEALERCANDLLSALRIDVYGVGSSALAAIDLQQKLHRAGHVAFSYTDPHLAMTGASLLDSQGVAVLISNSGRTREVLEVEKAARQNGAVTIAITNDGTSPLAVAASHVLLTAAREPKFRAGAMSSRIAQLAVVDFLFVRIAQREYGAISQNLQRSYDAVRDRRSE